MSGVQVLFSMAIPLSIDYQLCLLTSAFYSSEKPQKLWILAYFLSEWQTKFGSSLSFRNLIKLLGLIK